MTNADGIIADLPQIAGGWQTITVDLGRRQFQLCLPADPDALLDVAVDDTIPYWAYLWPTSYDMAAWILSTDWRPPGDVLEIGSGIGLTGLAGLAAGWPLIFSDFEPLAVHLATVNARLNSFTDAGGALIDWRESPPQQYSAIFGCDVTYERADHASLLNFLDAALIPDGVCWLADCHRAATEEFLAGAREHGYEISSRDLPAVDFPHRPKFSSVLRRLTRGGF